MLRNYKPAPDIPTLPNDSPPIVAEREIQRAKIPLCKINRLYPNRTNTGLVRVFPPNQVTFRQNTGLWSFAVIAQLIFKRLTVIGQIANPQCHDQRQKYCTDAHKRRYPW